MNIDVDDVERVTLTVARFVTNSRTLDKQQRRAVSI